MDTQKAKQKPGDFSHNQGNLQQVYSTTDCKSKQAAEGNPSKCQTLHHERRQVPQWTGQSHKKENRNANLKSSIESTDLYPTARADNLKPSKPYQLRINQKNQSKTAENKPTKGKRNYGKVTHLLSDSFDVFNRSCLT